MIVMDGKKVASELQNAIKANIEELNGAPPVLKVILVGDNEASKVYVKMKEKACARVGIESETIRLPAKTTMDKLLTLIDQLNRDSSVTGILVQLPLPPHMNEDTVLQAIDPVKDVDGFHPFNMGLLWASKAQLVPSTPAGIMELLRYYNIPIEGKRAVIVGRSNIVGKPMAALLLSKNATVTICHSRTRDLAYETSRADILIAAVGRPEIITSDMVNEGAVVIDVGINRINGKLVGDVDFKGVSTKASYLTPVPGGVGPMTVAYLMKNTLTAYMLQHST